LGDPGADIVYAFVNTGGTSYTKFTVATGVDVQGMALGDLDEDQDLDLFVADKSGKRLIIYENDGGSPDSWNAYIRTTQGSVGPNAGVITDVDGDGDNDIVGTGGGRVVMVQNDGTLEIANWGLSQIMSLSGAKDIVASDLDNDGDSDFVVTSSSSGSLVVIEDLGSSFSVVTAVSSATNIDPIAAGDINGDGLSDIAYAFTGGSTDTVIWLQGDGDPANAASWTSRTIASTLGDATALHIVDIDDDGDNDVVGSTRESDQITMYDNTAGDGSAWTERNLGSITNPDYLTPADLDGDNDVDFLLSYGGNFAKSLNTNIVPQLLSTSISNLDNINYIYTHRKAYNFVVTAEDGNGTANIDQLKLRFTVGTITYALSWDNDGPTCIASENPASTTEKFSISGTCTTSTTGNQLTVTFPVLVDWDIGDATSIDLEAYVADESGATDGWTTMQDNYFNIESDIEIDSDQWVAADSTKNPGDTGAINYRIDYEGTSLQVPDDQVSSVTALQDQGGDSDVTQTPGTTGAGTVSVTTSSSTGTYTFSPKVTLAGDGGESTADALNTTIVLDRVKLTNIQITGHQYLDDTEDRYWDDADATNDEMTATITAISERTSTPASGISVTLGDEDDTDRYGTATLSSQGVGVFVIEENPSRGQVIERDDLTVANAGNNDYGDDVNNNSLDKLNIGWDNDPPSVSFESIASEVTSGDYTVEPDITDDLPIDSAWLDVSLQNSGEPETKRTRMDGEDSDGTYYYRAKARDQVGNTSDVTTRKVVVDRENVSPNPVTEGFSPTNRTTVESNRPRISWTKSSDNDPVDLTSELTYEVRLDKDAEVERSYAYTWETNAGETSVQVDQNLSEGTWSWAVRAKDPRGGVSAFSSLQQFVVASEVSFDVLATLTIGVNVTSGVGQSKFPSIFGSVASAASGNGGDNTVIEVLGNRFLVESTDARVSILSALDHPVVNYAILGFLLLGLGYAVGVLRQQRPLEIHSPIAMVRSGVRRLWSICIFLVAPPTHSFEYVAPRNGAGTWVYSFASYKQHRRFSQMTVAAGAGLLVMKVLVIGITGLLLFENAHKVVGSSPYLDDNREVAPDDVLTYRVDFVNDSENTAKDLAFTAPVPDGATYIAGSTNFNGDPATDVEDSDAITFETSAQELEVSVDEMEADAEAYIEYRVRITEPTMEDEIEHAVFYEASSFSRTQTNTTHNSLTPSRIRGVVWNDENRDAIKDRLEPGLAGIKLRIYKDENSNKVVNPAVDTLLSTVTTPQNGSYDFSGLGFGIYLIVVEDSDAPEGFTRTTTSNTQIVPVIRGQQISDVNFGFAAPTSPDDTEGETPTSEPEITPDVVDQTDEQGRKTITIRELILAVPPGEEEILEGFEVLKFGTASDRRLLDQAGNFSITLKDNILIFEGRAKPQSTVKLTIYSDPYVASAVSNDSSEWTIQIAADVLDPGEHRVVAQVTDPFGRTSSDIEIARIVIQKEELSQLNLIIYGVLGLIIILLTVLIVHYIYRRDQHDDDEFTEH
ncbi:MAG: VCBS repeat-containing protein, partial [Candidatus Kerfeldbacteria bacterium]|nr:VCBS repeat-containing protein [Candidatus Kerfeldbacteria bacterium]